ncbi:pyrroline-5-carboxylate reductase [Ammoniphilus oxalaticus]|uniref:Pyrroline-5-carboxylate reductase n=1 Tax=Ammoniphilus oxalaticus TaxID=66863 RepID=A0A419SER1_9BACL|nr:pyrroline-5-carboxylate reductase [Ammoniphilus oxalaticus]RKD21747.1 pyrroline-5-carboxylate reductase [Ammoniphilus oxalaticus]
MLTNKKICFVGAGSMAEAVLAGILNQRIVKPGAISITNRSDRFRLDELVYNFGVVADADQKEKYIREADILILAMKPNDVESAIAEIKALTHSDQLIISVIAGITTTFISKQFGHHAPIVRAMPNTSATIGQSATGLCQGATATSEHLATASRIFEAIGMVVTVEEAQLDAVTGVSGSGPAYIYYIAEAILAGAMEAGLDQEMARELTLQTIIGAAQMLHETGETPTALREKVTSPNGTTQAGLDTLRSHKVDEAIVSCILKAKERSIELGTELTRSKA